MGNENKKKLVKRLEEIGVIRKQPVKLKHGAISDLYIDIKKAYGYPKALNILCESMRRIMNKRANCIAAAGYGGLPLAAALSSKYDLKLVLVREKPKTHGRNVWIDGYIPNAKDKVWIVDDVFTTGKSIRQVMKIVKRTKANVLGCGIVVNRAEGKISVSCKYILTAKEL